MSSYYDEQFVDHPPISVSELPSFLEDLGREARVLSLDCFDTLLWRKFALPSDVFYQLGKENELMECHLNISKRVLAETKSRKSRLVLGLSGEVTLEEIYKNIFPNSSEEAITSFVKNEINLEKQACFIFEPICDLVVSAKKRGLKTIIVSDTYLNAIQLQNLIEHCAEKIGRDCPIDHFFSSSDYRTSKSEGLLNKVAKDLNVTVNDIIHLGDNLEADFHGARRVGVNGYHLAQFNKQTEDIIHQFSNISSTLKPSIRYTEPLVCRWRPTWATLEEQTAVENISCYTLGPVFKNFSYWIAHQISKLTEKGEKPRLVFLLRDGYLPSIICREVALTDRRLKDIPITNLEMSRFVALACSFENKKRIIDYLEVFATTPAFNEILTQLLFSKTEIDSIVRKLPKTDVGLKKLYKEILLPQSIKKIIKRSGLYKERFYKRLASVVAPEPGDTLVMVDLGYSGTIHKCIEDILARDLDVKILSLFLLLKDSNQVDKGLKGMISPKQYDTRVIQSFTLNINPLEQVCANDSPSVRDFLENGDPVFSKEVIPLSQRSLRGLVQDATLRFLQKTSGHRLADISIAERNDETLLLLGRFLLTPSPDELALFNEAIHDVNLGSSQSDKIIDRISDEKSLQRRGIIGIGEPLDVGNAWRLAAVSANTASEYISSIRYGKNIKTSDSLHSQILVRFLSQNGSGQSNVNLYKTYNGFVRAIIPISASIDAFALFCGAKYKWVQLGGVYLEPIKSVFGKIDRTHEAISLDSEIIFENINVQADGILEMKSKDSFILVDLSSKKEFKGQGKNCFEFVFRPLVKRENN